jgi:hypothetical protein
VSHRFIGFIISNGTPQSRNFPSLMDFENSSRHLLLSALWPLNPFLTLLSSLRHVSIRSFLLNLGLASDLFPFRHSAYEPCFMSFPSHSPCFYYTVNVWLRVEIMNYLTMHVFRPSGACSLLGQLTYFSQSCFQTSVICVLNIHQM